MQNAYGAPRAEGASDLLRESEARFREFAEASSDVLWIRNAETLQWEYLSPAFEAVYGLSRERASQAEDNLLRWSELIVRRIAATHSTACRAGGTGNGSVSNAASRRNLTARRGGFEAVFSQ
jgi:PAS domain-containing protein